MATAWQLFELDPPAKWQAGTVGADHVPFYFDCAGCDVKEPPIAGMIGTGPTFSQAAIIRPKDGSFFVKAALYCGDCWPGIKASRLAAGTDERSEDAHATPEGRTRP